jgi:hypothetical protein
MRAIRRRTTIIFGSALVAGMMLAGCSAGTSDKASSSSQANGPQAAAPGLAEGAAGAGAPVEGKDSPAKAPDLSVDQRSIIYTGSITIRVEDVNVAAAKAVGIAATAGGFVGGDKRTTSDDASEATLQLRVPAGKFQPVVDELAKSLGTEQQRGISTEDVTEQTVDLDARIAVQQARVDSGRNLLAKAKSLSDLVMLEKEVATRESDLASLQSKKRHLADLSTLSTITVVLTHPKAAVVAKPAAQPGFWSGLKGGWKSLIASLGVLLTILGALLPWLLALGLPAWGIFYLIRRLRRPALAPAPVSPSAEPPAGA